MIVADIAVVRPIDVRPGLNGPGRLDGFAVAAGGELGGDTLGNVEDGGDRGAAQVTISRSECQPPELDACTPGVWSRRCRMRRSSSAFSAAAPGTSTAATGVANSPFTAISTRAMFVFPCFAKAVDPKRIGAGLSSLLLTPPTTRLTHWAAGPRTPVRFLANSQ
jgi:hypothetical protein